MLFKINGVNYDDFVVIKKYKMNRAPETTEYRDGWNKRHRTFLRESISGSVTLAFPNETAYNEFVENMRTSARLEGDYRVEAYVQNLNQRISFFAYLTTTTRVAVSTKEYGYVGAYFAVTIKVEER